MRLQLAAFRLIVGFVMMIHVAEQQAGITFVDDQPDIAVNSDRPEVLVLGFVELVEAHAWIGRIELQVERRHFDGLLLLASQSGEAVGEGVSNTKIHEKLPLRLNAMRTT